MECFIMEVAADNLLYDNILKENKNTEMKICVYYIIMNIGIPEN